MEIQKIFETFFGRSNKLEKTMVIGVYFLEAQYSSERERFYNNFVDFQQRKCVCVVCVGFLGDGWGGGVCIRDKNCYFLSQEGTNVVASGFKWNLFKLTPPIARDISSLGP